MNYDPLREQHYNATIVGERLLHGTVMVIRVRPDAPLSPPRPGQWVELGLGIWERVMDGAEAGSARRAAPDSLIKRAYSISSPILTSDLSRLIQPSEENGLEFFLSLVVPPAERSRKVPNLTGRLFCLREGDRLFMSSPPMGEYGLDDVRPGDDVLFLATGTGEAPHNRMIWELLRRDHEGRVASIVSVRRGIDLAYGSTHQRLAEMFPRYRYATLITREPGHDGRHLQDYLRDGTLEDMAGFPLDPARTHVFLCGNPGMIGPPRTLPSGRVFPEPPGMVELLEETRGFNDDPARGPLNVHYERYW